MRALQSCPPRVRTLAGIVIAFIFSLTPAFAAPFTVLKTTPLADKNAKAQLTVEIVEIVEIADAKKADVFAPLPARIIVTAADGSHPDGSGRDVYSDGRFFAEGTFTVHTAPGKTKVLIQCGPEYEPVESEVELTIGNAVFARVVMRRWFDAAARGWHGGDNHVHTQHDARATVRTDPSYTALQARANGLRFITEADHEVTADAVKKFDTASFLYRQSPELRPGPFVGHLNAPGISSPIVGDLYQQLVNQPLPAAALHAEIRKRGGAMIRTHPLSPPYQLHWMGTAETWSDAVLGQAGDLLDIDSQASELLYFAALNLGNHIGVSSYTDCALGRKQTMSPGDRRVYCKTKEFTYPAIVEAMRDGRTMATNGGPVFAFLTVGGKGPGESHVESIQDHTRSAMVVRCKVHSLRPLRSLEVFHGGGLLKSFDVKGKSGEVNEEYIHGVSRRPDWFVLRAEDEKGAWSITSPVYIDLDEEEKHTNLLSSALLFEISNHTRFIQLRKQFFAHIIFTVAPPETIVSIRLLRDGVVVKTWTPDEKEERQDVRIPVTDLRGEYGAGWAWHRVGGTPVHFQCDWPVKETGWYRVEVSTALKPTHLKQELKTADLRYNAENPNSHAISFAQIARDEKPILTLRGYGEEQALRDIRSPFVGDGWWYPKNTAWEMKGKFEKWEKAVGANQKKLADYFR